MIAELGTQLFGVGHSWLPSSGAALCETHNKYSRIVLRPANREPCDFIEHGRDNVLIPAYAIRSDDVKKSLFAKLLFVRRPRFGDPVREENNSISGGDIDGRQVIGRVIKSA